MGKVRMVCAKQEGQSSNGNLWEKQTLVINVTAGDKEVPVAITFFGERRTAWLKELKPGQLIEVAVAIESREFDNRWYTDVQGFGIMKYEKQTAKAEATAEQQAEPAPLQMPGEDQVDF